MWRVDLSEVTASRLLEGEMPREYMTAWSTPRLNSAILVQLLVENIRINVPF